MSLKLNTPTPFPIFAFPNSKPSEIRFSNRYRWGQRKVERSLSHSLPLSSASLSAHAIAAPCRLLWRRSMHLRSCRCHYVFARATHRRAPRRAVHPVRAHLCNRRRGIRQRLPPAARVAVATADAGVLAAGDAGSRNCCHLWTALGRDALCVPTARGARVATWEQCYFLCCWCTCMCMCVLSCVFA